MIGTSAVSIAEVGRHPAGGGEVGVVAVADREGEERQRQQRAVLEQGGDVHQHRRRG